jgi:hypothetical protein
MQGEFGLCGGDATHHFLRPLGICDFAWNQRCFDGFDHEAQDEGHLVVDSPLPSLVRE